ncbi:GntR family transcriptional regulator [Williamsia deligens]|uniref:GntR family transcriptional regulator n=1 Tax=Williamsia deligens TaxID=321325 RepID=A0ABW3G2S0_9NOCA|nr:GntR family transcriptional regulator [Williamsia deligens]MCP2194243.1 DNA-binding transcriptional regulator, GntR family [Williamsia deligens]
MAAGSRRRVLAPLVQESTPAIIARQLRVAIADGGFPPGSQLTEAGLAADLGVSRGPLREAMQRLTQEGLLVSHRNRGLFVISMDDDDINDMYVARTAIERAALAQVVAHHDDDDLAELRAAIDHMQSFADDPNGREIADADMAFHAQLVECARSPRLSRIHETILVETRMCLGAMRGTYASAQARIDEHTDLLRAVEVRDAEAADRLMIAHMRDGLMRLLPEESTETARAVPPEHPS